MDPLYLHEESSYKCQMSVFNESSTMRTHVQVNSHKCLYSEDCIPMHNIIMIGTITDSFLSFPNVAYVCFECACCM